ncbi:MmgE/PrpD family protein [Mesorhizobium sp. CN2-181]|uniref:MmgE/PrpD family protein n=1 Tax=Mesorhizobium yinganensis TaxID=3157707 RepID=UPI0032B8424A
MTQQNPVPWLAQRVLSTTYDTLPALAVDKAKTFLLDSFGVGVAGCAGFAVDKVIKVASGWGAADEATVWVSGERLPATGAAFVNAYQIHSLEFDCVNEDAVLHPMATLLSALFAYAERRSRAGKPVSGKDFLTAAVAGVDLSVFLGKSSNGPIRFFRPAAAGGFGAAAALGKLEGLDAEKLARILGNQYSQTCGTMQSHVEGSPLLGMQVGFNARAALVSCDLAREGLLGPNDVLTGQYGYFRLFEADDFDVEHGKRELEAHFQIELMSHKPFPTGRLTHGPVDGLNRLMKEHGFVPDDIEAITCTVPSLVKRLVGRPDVPTPQPNYAKLCLPFVAGTFLNHGKVDVEHFIGPDMLNNEKTHGYAARVTVVQDDNPNPNTMVPQTLDVKLKSGKSHGIRLGAVYGHPDAPLTRDENLDKFRRCWKRAGLKPETGETFIGIVDEFETIDDVAGLTKYLVK